jgi:hypothetical protein
VDPDPAFHSCADSDPGSQNNADPDPQPYICLFVHGSVPKKAELATWIYFCKKVDPDTQNHENPYITSMNK